MVWSVSLGGEKGWADNWLVGTGICSSRHSTSTEVSYLPKLSIG